MPNITESPHRLRPATPEDAVFQLALYASTREEEMNAAGFPTEMREPFVIQQFTAQTTFYTAEYPAAEWWIIECDGKPAGRLILDRAGDHFHLIDIILIPEFRGQGIGTHYLKQVQTEAGALGLPVRLFAATGERALRLYLRLGFQILSDNGVHIELVWRAATPPPGDGTLPLT